MNTHLTTKVRNIMYTKWNEFFAIPLVTSLRKLEDIRKVYFNLQIKSYGKKLFKNIG